MDKVNSLEKEINTWMVPAQALKHLDGQLCVLVLYRGSMESMQHTILP